jgi:hypothetical protein
LRTLLDAQLITPQEAYQRRYINRRLQPCRATRSQREGQVGRRAGLRGRGAGAPISCDLMEAFFQLPLL